MSDTAVTVEVKLYGLLRDRGLVPPGQPAHRPFPVTLPHPGTVADLIDRLGLADGLINVVAVNDEAARLDQILQAGDRVSLFPPTAGG